MWLIILRFVLKKPFEYNMNDEWKSLMFLMLLEKNVMSLLLEKYDLFVVEI